QPAGGSAPYTWTISDGSLPGGLTFSSSGQISGTATSSGTFGFTVQVTDANSNKASKQMSLTVAGTLSITSTALPAGGTGSPYSQTFTAAGGTPPYSWSVTAGAAPAGLTLEIPTGMLLGMPTATGNYVFTVTVTDSNSVSANKQFTVAIGGGVSISTAGQLPD